MMAMKKRILACAMLALMLWALVVLDGKRGYIDKTGKVVVPLS